MVDSRVIEMDGYTVIRHERAALDTRYRVVTPDGNEIRCGTTWHSVERAMRMDRTRATSRMPDDGGDAPERPPRPHDAGERAP